MDSSYSLLKPGGSIKNNFFMTLKAILKIPKHEFIKLNVSLYIYITCICESLDQ